jgi:hypothetical protein
MGARKPHHDPAERERFVRSKQVPMKSPARKITVSFPEDEARALMTVLSSFDIHPPHTDAGADQQRLGRLARTRLRMKLKELDDA